MNSVTCDVYWYTIANDSEHVCLEACKKIAVLYYGPMTRTRQGDVAVP
jgi:hypothetical protein